MFAANINTISLSFKEFIASYLDDTRYELIDGELIDEEYEALGIPEYWIVDYLGLGGKRYIGLPKQPVITIYQLADEIYQGQQFRGEERVLSATFPDLNLAASQIFAAAA